MKELSGRRRCAWDSEAGKLLSLRLECGAVEAEWTTVRPAPEIPRLDVLALRAAVVIVVNAWGVRLR
jgi:hypothetical protein